MIDQESLAVTATQFSNHFIQPRYDSYSFVQLPQTVRALLTDDTRQGVSFGPREDLYKHYDAVILFFVDALGWRFFEQFRDQHPFLQRFVAEGLVTKLSSQFPSTTGAHVTAIHTGLPVGQSGVHEWFYYEPLVDAVIAPLLYSFAGDHERDTLAQTGVPASALYPQQTLYQGLRDEGVKSYVFQPYGYAYSPYTRVVTDGAQIVPYRTMSEAIVQLDELLAHQEGPSYYFLYYDAIDTICHWHGPESPQVTAEIETFLDVMERQLQSRLAKTRPRTLFLMTADHGQAAIDPHTTVFLNQTLPDIHGWLKRNRAGQLIVPTGSPRDMFLHIKEPMLDEAQVTLQSHLAGKAEVQRVKTLTDAGYFGPAPTARFRERVGNLVVLPYGNESVWWYEQGRFEQPFKGQHGGLSPNEMQTILLVQPYG